MKLRRILILAPLILVISFSLGDSNNWVLKRHENGIEVYTRDAVGYSIKQIRIIDTVKSSLSGIVAIILDLKNYPSWVYRCGAGKTLTLINNREQYDYELTDVPWPFENRDVITYSKIDQDSLTKTVTISSEAMPDYLPSVNGTVRIRQFHSLYVLKKLINGSVKVDYTLYADPGGDIPAWLVNATIIIGPYNSTAEMIKRLPQYQSMSYPFIKE